MSETYRWQFVPAEEPVVASLLRAHLAGDGQTVVLTVLVVALDIKVSEIDSDPASDKMMITIMMMIKSDDDDDHW